MADEIDLLTEDFVDRQDQLALLLQLALGQVQARVGVVSGPEGIGKTYLLKELAAQCTAKGLLIGHVLPDVAHDLNEMTIVLRLWEDLGLGEASELYQKIAFGRAERLFQYVPAPESPGGQVGMTVSGNPNIYGPIITGKVDGDVVYKAYLQLVFDDDPKTRQEVQDVVTPFLKERMVQLGQEKKAVLILDSWDSVLKDKQTSPWLMSNLLRWILEGEIPNTTLVIAGVKVPEFSYLPQRVSQIELTSLPDEAVKAYWVGKCMLSPEDVPMVVEITNGIPQALYLAAKKTKSIKSQSFDGKIPSSHGPEPEKLTRNAVESLLEVLPAEFAKLIRLCALPHWFDRKLFNLLAMQVGSSETYFDQLLELRFVLQEEAGIYAYNPSVRRDLLAGWLRGEQVDAFARSYQPILDHFDGLKDKVSRRQDWAVEKEILYFKLLVNEDLGLKDLSERFEKALRLLQYGLAGQYLEHIKELQEILTPNASLWLRYFSTRLEAVHSRDRVTSQDYESILSGTPDPVLQGACKWRQGLLLVENQQWVDAVKLYSQALRLSKKGDSTLYTMLVTLARAEAYNDLALRSGGFHIQSIDRKVPWQTKFLQVIQHLPYLLYEWGVHHIRFLPNWYFGTNYQDWILDYLLMEAGHWYSQAAKIALDRQDVYWHFELQLGLANVEHQLGRWSRAQKRFAELLALDLVDESPYRKALVKLGQGEALASEGKLHQANKILEDAATIFEQFHDEKNEGRACARLAQINLTLGQFDRAVEMNLRGLQVFEKVPDSLSATELVDNLEDLKDLTSSPNQAGLVEEVIQRDLPRHYLTRFPDTLLSWYRKVAMYGAMPLTYLVLVFLSFASGFILSVLEGEFILTQKGFRLGTSFHDAIIILAVVLLPIPISLWLYRFFYSLIGFLVVYRLGSRLSPIEQEQPRELALQGETLRISANTEEAQEIPWTEVVKVGHDSTRLINREISLVSRTILVLEDRSTQIIDGVTSGYDHLQKDLQRRLKIHKPLTEFVQLNFQILNGRWIAVISFLAALLTGYLWINERIHGKYEVTSSGAQIFTFLGPIAIVFLPTFTLAFVSCTLWRNLSHSLSIRRKLGVDPTTFPDWIRWFVAILASLITFLWVLVFFV